MTVHFEGIFKHLIPWLPLQDIIKSSALNSTIFSAIQSQIFSNQALKFDRIKAPLKEVLTQFLSSSLTKKGELIRNLSFAFNQSFTNDLIPLLPCSLTELDLSGCQSVTDVGLDFLAKQCNQLQSLSLYWTLHITDAGLKSVLLANLASLRHLNIAGCRSLTDQTCAFLGEHGSQLLSLDLTRLPNLTCQALLYLENSLPALQTLRLYGLQQLPSEAFDTLHRFHRLKRLDLTGCLVTDEQVCCIIRNCSDLEELILSWCVNLTGTVLRELAKMHPALKLLSLHGIQNITSNCFKEVIGSTLVDSLEIIDIRGCVHLHKEYIQNGYAGLKSAFPKLKGFEVHGVA